jgi:hypothetical protein
MTLQGGDDPTSENKAEAKKPRSNIEILQRRLKVFEYWAGRDLGPTEIQRLLAAEVKISVSLKTVKRDLATMDVWLPALTKLKEEGSAATAELLGTLRIIRQRALNLGTTADNASARVGALKAAGEAIGREMDLRLKTGQIRAVPAQVEVKHELKGFDADEISRYIGTIISVAMDHEARDTDKDDDKPDPTKPVDPKAPPP